MNWYVIYTKSRFEKKTELLLLEKGIEAYCPKREVSKQWSDRKKLVVEPLFRSYVFVKINQIQKYDVLNTDGVVTFIGYKGGQMATMRESEIERIKAMLNEYDHQNIKIKTFEPNELVTISSGAFMDFQGRVIDHKGHKTTLYLEQLGLKIEIDLEKNILEKNIILGNQPTAKYL